MRDQAGIRSRRQPLGADLHLAAWREQLDVPAKIGVNIATVDHVVGRARRAARRAEQDDPAMIEGLIGKQRRDGISPAQVGVIALAGGVVVFKAARVQFVVVDLSEEHPLLRWRQHLEIGIGTGLAAAVAVVLLQPGIERILIGLRHLARVGRISVGKRGVGLVRRIEIKRGKAVPVDRSDTGCARPNAGL